MNKIAYLDGVPLEISAGETLLQFARRHEGHEKIPTLCNDDHLAPFGACRVCSVEVATSGEGARRVVAACHTPVAENIHIFTESRRIQRLRKNIIELVLTDHPLTCLTCEVDGNCELQTVAARVGIDEVRYAPGDNHLAYPRDESHPYMRANLSKCINCSRCLRACDEIQGEFVLAMAGRGFRSRIIKGSDESFKDSPCVSCGACAQTCPTAAISDVFRSKSIVASKKSRTVCTYCGVGCNLEVAVKNDEILSIQAVNDAEVNAGHTCLKGRYAFKFYNHPDRVRSPLIKRNGRFVEVSWDEVYDHITGKLAQIKSQFGADAIAGISSARCTNEENFLMQKFIRAVIGTNNIDCCARVCHAPTAKGMQQSFGTGAATNSISDLYKTELILVVGANPTSAHPVTGAKIKQRAMKGVPLIVIDPMKTELARHATYHLQLRPGTNGALLNLLAWFIIEADLVDREFVDKRCEGFEDYMQKIQRLDIAKLEALTGVNRKLAKQAALAYARADRAMSFHGLGVTEHSQGSRAVMLVANLAMMTGNIGREGVGVNPLRGQNNVQGAADMGVQPHQGAGYLDVVEHQQYYEQAYGCAMPVNEGLKIPQMFEAAETGDLKALWIIGEDVVQSDPNSQHVARCLENLDLLIVQDIFMTETAKLANVFLPATSFLEKSGTFTNGERRIQRVNQAVIPLPGTRRDGQIILDVMNRMGFPQQRYDSAVQLEEIARVVPFFEGVKWHELGDNGKQWPVLKDGSDSRILHVDTFKRGKGRFHFFEFEETQEIKDNHSQFPFILTTGRNLVHYNCGTMTRRTKNKEIMQQDVLLINPKDAAGKHISDNREVRLFSKRGEVRIKAKLSNQVNPGVLFTTFHFPELMINRVTSNITDLESQCPEYKVVSVDFEAV